MPDRRIILRVLLAALGVAAVSGATAMLLGTSDVMGRVAGTALVLAVACGLMLPLSLMIDRARHRQAGLTGMAVVVAQFVLAMVLIWLPDWARPGGGWWRLHESIAITMVALGVAGPVAMFFFEVTGFAVARVAGRVGLVLTAVVFLLVVVAGWAWWGRSSRWWWQERLLGTALSLGGLGLPVVGALVGQGHKTARLWRWLGVVAAAVAFVMAMVHIWGDPRGGEAIFVTVVSIAVVVAHANLTLFCPLKPGQAWLLVATIAAAIVTAAAVDGHAFWRDSLLPFSRLAAAAGILAACGTLALLVLARLNRGVRLENLVREFADITLVCPRCRRKQKLALGDSACSACGLRITTQIEEPRCNRCGYLLYVLTSDACPECGEPVTSSAGAPSGDA